MVIPSSERTTAGPLCNLEGTSQFHEPSSSDSFLGKILVSWLFKKSPYMRLLVICRQYDRPRRIHQALKAHEAMRRGLYHVIDPKKPELSVTGKVVIITQAGGGFGYDTAAAWPTAWVSEIAEAGRTLESLNSAAEYIKSNDKNIPIFLQLIDVASRANVKELYENVNEKFSRVDVVANNTATRAYESIVDIEPGMR